MRTCNGAINCSSVYVHLFLLFWLLFLSLFTWFHSWCFWYLQKVAHVHWSCVKGRTLHGVFKAPRALSTFGRFFLWGRQLFALWVNSFPIHGRVTRHQYRLGSLRYHDGDGSKHIAYIVTSRSIKLKRDYPISVFMFYVGELSWRWILQKNIQVYKE